jgi:hypothetical protein
MHPNQALGRHDDRWMSPHRRSVRAVGHWACGTYHPVVSYEVYLFRFQRGECMDIDAARLMEMIQPLIVWRDEEHDCVGLRTADGGEADLYGVGEDAATLMFSHWSWGDICDLMAKLARELDMVIVPPDRLAMLIDERQRAHLPEEFMAEAVVVRTGIDIQRVINPASLAEAAET